MGFGKKTDPITNRTLDLDKTFTNIIQPAVVESGFTCIRADEIQGSGIIDKYMYGLLVKADLVIADISTYNPNAIYELGVRHAVRPYSTIIIKEQDGKIPFDLDHNKIFMYKHLGEDIGADESRRCIEGLKKLIKSIIENPDTDSPVYHNIKINPQEISEYEYAEIIKELAEKDKHLFAKFERAKESMKNGNFDDAHTFWEKCSELAPNETYFVQQMALCKYKSKIPDESNALIDALKIIGRLNPTTDPETFGITGAIYKNLYMLHSDENYLERAIENYKKGFNFNEDYYTGENYALCLNIKANLKTGTDEAIYCSFEAKVTREKIVKNLEKMIQEDNFDKRHDKFWINATLAHCYYVEKDTRYKDFETKFLSESAEWQKNTYLKNKKVVDDLLKLKS